MASGSIDYWVTKDSWLYSLLTIVKDAVKEGGLIQIALDSMDGKLDGFVDLATLTEAQTVYLAKMFLTDTVDGNGLNLLTKLDLLDGVEDGKLDLNLLKTFDIFYDNATIESRLQSSIDQLILAVAQLVGVHTDTTAMIDFAEEDYNGEATQVAWSLVSSVHATRNLLLVNNLDDTYPIYYSRDGSSSAGSIGSESSATFYDSPGVWLKAYVGSGGSYWTAHEEWAT